MDGESDVTLVAFGCILLGFLPSCCKANFGKTDGRTKQGIKTMFFLNQV